MRELQIYMQIKALFLQVIVPTLVFIFYVDNNYMSRII